MQLLAKFKKILYMEIRATLNFRKFKMALHPMYLSIYKTMTFTACHPQYAVKNDGKV